MVVVGGLGHPHDLRCQQRLAEGDRLLDRHPAQGFPAVELRIPPVLGFVLDHARIVVEGAGQRGWQDDEAP